MKKIMCVLLSFMIFCQNVFALGFEDIIYSEKYNVVSISQDGITNIVEADDFDMALSLFEQYKDSYDNLGITKDGIFYKVEYGIVAFDKSEACDINVEFLNKLDGSNNYLNGCYGNDAAYIDTTAEQKVEFKISGVTGLANFDDVTIIPLEFLNDNSLSMYKVIDGKLYHHIKKDVSNDLYSNLINLGEAPTYLAKDTSYYSYDGHYFYDNMGALLEDYQNGSYGLSVNANEPYYNYYQFVSHRSLTNITQQDMENYLKDQLLIDDVIYSYEDMDKDSADDSLTRSQFYGNEFAFYQYQYQYGANAAMMMALAMNESAFGRSSLAFTRNNLFGHAAYDSDVERNASRYLSVMSSIYSHAKYYISGTYCYPSKFQYHGGFFGNKASGMNVSYASDPYWGEKAAQYYYKLDEALGFKDKDAYTLGVNLDSEPINIYQYSDVNSQILYQSNANNDYVFIILEAFEANGQSWYKVQSDASLNANSNVELLYDYDFANHVGYILQENVELILPGKNSGYDYVNVSFDANGGTFKDGSGYISYNMPVAIPSIETPTKDNALFVGWDKELANVLEDTVYVAQYQDVNSIELVSIPKQAYEINERIDLTNGSVKVNFADGSSKEFALTTAMVSGYDLSSAGEQEVLVSYAGCTTTYPISVSQELDDLRKDLTNKINEVLELDPLQLSADDKAQLLVLKNEINEGIQPTLSFAQLRNLDKLIYASIDKRIQYRVDSDIAVSGLSLVIPIKDSLSKTWLKDFYSVSKGKADHKATLEKVAKANDYTIHEAFSIKIRNRLSKIEVDRPFIISLPKPANYSANEMFKVLAYENGEVRECNTTQTDNYIQFMSDGNADYLLVSKTSANTYSEKDVLETINQTNSETDILTIIGFGAFGTLIVIIGIIIALKIRRRMKYDSKKRRYLQDQVSEDDGGSTIDC
ncbi:MAG: glucosaminidase domain-containing protein [Erysipelotrichaceae bacterium]|nr:glucosaminidase domain-containing protein [Erysipelotrichaceae bacterium]MDY5252503.1 glucosaminidase domain-containing protein [Erysipelotrichaceae bacterium]